MALHVNGTTDTGQRRELVFQFRLQGKGYQARAGGKYVQPELLGYPVTECGGAHGGNRQATGGDHQGFTGEIAGADAQAVAAVDFGNAVDRCFHSHFCSCPLAFGQQHVEDILGAVLAEQLARGFFLMLNAVPVYQFQKILGRVALECGNAVVRVVRQEVGGRAVQVGEVAAAATGHQDFLARFVGVVQYQNAAAPIAGGRRAHQARCAGADDDDVVL